jgi:signal transduction histidine kinase
MRGACFDGTRGAVESVGRENVAVTLQERVEAERVSALYRRAWVAHAANLANASIMVAINGRDIWSPQRRFGWLGAVAVMVLLRSVGAWIRGARPDLLSPRVWGRIFVAGTVVSGALWAALAVLMWGPTPLHHALVAFVTGGMAAGATASTMGYVPAFVGFAWVALPPIILRLFRGGPVDMAMGLMLAIFVVAMTKLAATNGRAFIQNVELRLRNEMLVGNLSRARQDLEARVSERTVELQRTVAQLRAAEAQAKAAVRTRDEFLAVASHELRTPVTVLELQLRRVERKLLRGERTRDVESAFRILRRQSHRLADLVDAVMTASGLSEDGLSIEPRDVDLAAVVRSVTDDIVATAAPSAGPLALRLEEPLVGRWDPLRVEQIVVNLISNAMKFGLGKPVTVSLAREDHEAVLRVRDEGPGITPTDRERIFERFFRSDVDRGVAGLGLGLSIVRDLAHAMGGWVAVASEPGHGAEFTVSLPTA